MSDYIDRQAAIDALCKVGCGSSSCGIPCDEVKAIEQLPSVEIKPTEEQIQKYILDHNLTHKIFEPVKRGKWIYDNQFHWYRASCSECGYKRVTDIKAEKWNGWKYCPNCGAKMEGEEA